MSDHIRTLLVAYMDGELTSSERQAVEDALHTDPALRAEFDQLKTLRERVIGSLHGQGAEAQAPPDAFAQLQARLQRPKPTADEPIPAHPNGGRSIMYRHNDTQNKRWAWLSALGLTAAASLLILIAAVFIITRMANTEQIVDSTRQNAITAGEGSSPITDATPIEEPVDDTLESQRLSDYILAWGYIPPSFYAQNATGYVTEDGHEVNEYRYSSDDQFVIVTESTTSDEPLPEGTVLVVQGSPATVQSGLSGTADLTSDTPRTGAPDPGSVVGGGGGGGDVPYPDQIDYASGLRIVWDDGIRRVDVLTNLTTDEALRVVNALAWEPSPQVGLAPTAALPDGDDLPTVPSVARAEVRSNFTLAPPEGFFGSTMLDVWDENEGHISERRYNSSDKFIIVTRTLSDEGDSTATGSFGLRDQPALLTEELSGTANITVPVLQDGVERGVFGVGGGLNDASQTNPDTIPYEDGIRLEWVEEGIYWTVLSNLPQAELVEVLEGMRIIPASDEPVQNTALEGLTFDVVLPNYVPEGMELLEGGPVAYGAGANFAYYSDDGRKMAIRQFEMDTSIIPQGHERTVDIETGDNQYVTGYVYPGEDVTTELANGATITIIDGTAILFDLQPSVRVVMTTTLPLEEAVRVAESMLR